MSATLGWAGLATSAVGVVSYFMAPLRRPQWVRILNGSGLLFTALALSSSRMLLRDVGGADAFAVQVAVGLLIVGVLVQVAAALRNRRAWDRAQRRSSLLESRA